jgi:hypothetical protein
MQLQQRVQCAGAFRAWLIDVERLRLLIMTLTMDCVHAGLRSSRNAVAVRRAARVMPVVQAKKVAVLGAAGGIGQPLSLLLKMNKCVTELALFDVAPIVKGVAVDISHCNTPVKVGNTDNINPIPAAAPILVSTRQQR